MVPELERLIQAHQNIVFFGGAGVSTESGIPDFRSVDGLYHQKFKYPPETMLSHTFYEQHTAEFFDFYRQKLIVHGAKPNAAHLRLAKLEREGKLKAVVTQNIDGLHQAAGAVVAQCGTVQLIHGFAARCTDCGGIVKPDVVLYEEGLDEATIEGAVSAIRRADMLIVGGTSLAVYPAAGLIRYFRGDDLVVINKQPTPADGMATLLVNKPIGQALSETEGEGGAICR